MLRRSQERNVRSLARWSRVVEAVFGMRRGARRGWAKRGLEGCSGLDMSVS